MNVDSALSNARFLLDWHGLCIWTVDWHKGLAHLGECHFPEYIHEPGKITLAKGFVRKSPWVAVQDVILHEVAHALAWLSTGETDHGPAWRACCLQVGARPEVVSPFTDHILWKAICGRCTAVHWLNRRRKQSCYLCRKCGTILEFVRNVHD